MTFFKFFKYQKIINNIFKAENLKDNLSSLFGTDLQKDWVGRYWVVLNPYVQNMKDEIGRPESTFSYDEVGKLTNTAAVEKWVMDKMNVAGTMMVNNGLFELLTYSISKLDEDQNYLFIIENILWKDFAKTSKFLAILLILLIIAGAAFLIFW